MPLLFHSDQVKSKRHFSYRPEMPFSNFNLSSSFNKRFWILKFEVMNCVFSPDCFAILWNRDLQFIGPIFFLIPSIRTNLCTLQNKINECEICRRGHRNKPLVLQVDSKGFCGWCIINCFNSFGWGETESTWYVGHYLAYSTSPGW
jgi:hypothetical protein